MFIDLRFGRSATSLILLIVAAACPVSGQTWSRVRDGVEHAEVRRDFSGKPVDIDLLKLDLKKVRVDVQHAGGRTALGTETTSSIARRTGAIAAINAGFFRLDTSPYLGDPVGLFVVDGTILSEQTNERIQMIINNGPARTDVRFTRTRILQRIRMGELELDINGLNRERKADEAVVYTPEFGNSTLTQAGGIEVVVIRGVVTAVSQDVGNSVIPRNGYVISVAGKDRSAVESAAKSSATVTLTQTWDGIPKEFEKDRARLDVVTGVPQLVRAGQVEITWEQERSTKAFVETRHPRTAVAKLKDGRLLTVTADGRTEQSGGLSLADLAAFLIEMGAVEAINLDGGGSTTMFVNGKVVNSPSDKEGERKVSDALVVTPRKR